MRDHCVERGRETTYVSWCQCCSSKISARAEDLAEFCEPCLQVVKQCPPKKRFMRGAHGGMKPRPIIVKPANSIALDRLVEVALSPTGLDATKSTEFTYSPTKDPGVDRSSDGEVPAMESPNCKKKPMVMPRYSRPLETDQIKSPQPRSSKAGHGDHSKKFTPRFKSLLDISC